MKRCWMMCWCRWRRLLPLVILCATIFLAISYSISSSSQYSSSAYATVEDNPRMNKHSSLDRDRIIDGKKTELGALSLEHREKDLYDNDYYHDQKSAAESCTEHLQTQTKDSNIYSKLDARGFDDETIVNRNHFQFQKENTDLFTEIGDESDYFFPPCEDISAFQANSLYGFVGPFRYLANYKNPCWMERGDGGVFLLYCVPYFYLVGAPKAGSTDVYKRLSMHPEVVKPASKETRWFDRARFSDAPHFSSFLRNFYNASGVIYRSLDRGSNYHRRIIGDGSPSYFFDNRHWPLMPGNEGCSEPRVTVASHIHHLYPQAKIIFILRNPVDRLYSSYLYNHAKYEPVNSSTFDRYARDAVQLYDECFARYSLRQCANNATVFQQAKVMLIVSLYSVFVHDWLELFPRQQLLVISTEEYNQNMAEHLNRIFAFLGLRTLNGTELQTILQPAVYNRGQHYSGAGPMWKETRKLLEDFFRPYNQQLASLLNDPDFLWLNDKLD